MNWCDLKNWKKSKKTPPPQISRILFQAKKLFLGSKLFPSTYFWSSSTKFLQNLCFHKFGVKTKQTAHGVKKQQLLQLDIMKTYCGISHILEHFHEHMEAGLVYKFELKVKVVYINHMILVRIEIIISPWPLTMAVDDYRARLTKSGPHPSKKWKNETRLWSRKYRDW